MMPLRIFISYADEDKDVVGRIKRGLEHYGIDVFCAHDDIKPFSEWTEEIINELREADVIVSVHSDAFDASDFTYQEIGFALALGKRILPLKLNRAPHGFISKYQALTVHKDVIGPACRTMFKRLCEDKKLEPKLRISATRALADAESFAQAEQKAQILLDFDHWTASQLDKVIYAMLSNSQALHSWGAHAVFEKISSSWGGPADEEAYNDYETQYEEGI